MNNKYEHIFLEVKMLKKLTYIKNGFLIFVVFISVLFLGCSSYFTKNPNQTDSLKIVSWNLQTFFDSVTEGTEYSEFRDSKSSWTEEKYQDRLKYLCDFIENQNADIYAFTELENLNILQDIANNLKTKSILGSDYKYACFGKNPGGVFGCGIISKYPLKDLKLHNLDFSTTETQPELRPIVEVTASTGTNKEFTLFVCHWKSKSGGAEESEIWRDFQEKLLEALVKKAKNKQIVACGDFNRDLQEFSLLDEEKSIELKSFYQDSTESTKMQNPWIVSQEKGSYNFNGEWNKIDHFFISNNIRILNFGTIQEFTNDSGFPIKYSVRTGNGYSDHLPIFCTLDFLQDN